MKLVFFCITEIRIKYHKQNVTVSFRLDVAVPQRDAIFSINIHLRCYIFGNWQISFYFVLFLDFLCGVEFGIWSEKTQDLIGRPQKVILIHYYLLKTCSSLLSQLPLQERENK